MVMKYNFIKRKADYMEVMKIMAGKEKSSCHHVNCILDLQGGYLLLRGDEGKAKRRLYIDSYVSAFISCSSACTTLSEHLVYAVEEPSTRTSNFKDYSTADLALAYCFKSA